MVRFLAATPLEMYLMWGAILLALIGWAIEAHKRDRAEDERDMYKNKLKNRIFMQQCKERLKRD